MADWDGIERRGASDMATLSARLESLHNDVSDVKSALSSLTTAITKLAIIEEKQTVANSALERAFTAIAKVETRLLDLEKMVPIHNRNNVWMERGIIAIVGAAVMFVWDNLKK